MHIHLRSDDKLFIHFVSSSCSTNREWLVKCVLHNERHTGNINARLHQRYDRTQHQFWILEWTSRTVPAPSMRWSRRQTANDTKWILNFHSEKTDKLLTFTVNRRYAVKLKNISVCAVLQWLTIVACSTVKSALVHVKFENNWLTWSCVLKWPAMNWPVPNGYETDDTSNATMPGYRKRLQEKTFLDNQLNAEGRASSTYFFCKNLFIFLLDRMNRTYWRCNQT